jgi:D-xylose transport system substrate-binding protein
MRTTLVAVAVAALAAGLAAPAFAQDDTITVGVSWSNFQEERWKTDEAAIVEALEAAGAEYVSADASPRPPSSSPTSSRSSPRAWTRSSCWPGHRGRRPAVQAAADEGIPSSPTTG